MWCRCGMCCRSRSRTRPRCCMLGRGSLGRTLSVRCRRMHGRLIGRRRRTVGRHRLIGGGRSRALLRFSRMRCRGWMGLGSRMRCGFRMSRFRSRAWCFCGVLCRFSRRVRTRRGSCRMLVGLHRMRCSAGLRMSLGRRMRTWSGVLAGARCRSSGAVARHARAFELARMGDGGDGRMTAICFGCESRVVRGCVEVMHLRLRHRRVMLSEGCTLGCGRRRMNAAGTTHIAHIGAINDPHLS